MGVRDDQFGYTLRMGHKVLTLPHGREIIRCLSRLLIDVCVDGSSSPKHQLPTKHERPLRALLLLLLTPIIFALIYLFLGIDVGPPETTIKYVFLWPPVFFEPGFWISLWDHFTYSLMYSISIMSLGKTGCDISSPGKCSFFVSVLQILISVVFISLFILAMNRKFRRTKD